MNNEQQWLFYNMMRCKDVNIKQNGNFEYIPDHNWTIGDRFKVFEYKAPDDFVQKAMVEDEGDYYVSLSEDFSINHFHDNHIEYFNVVMYRYMSDITAIDIVKHITNLFQMVKPNGYLMLTSASLPVSDDLHNVIEIMTNSFPMIMFAWDVVEDYPMSLFCLKK